jgi:hypothetical protein
MRSPKTLRSKHRMLHDRCSQVVSDNPNAKRSRRKMTGRRRFGSVRKRSSGRWQAEYWHEGRRRSIGTFSTKAEAWAVLSTIEVDLHKGAWLDPRAGQVTLGVFANGWQRQRPELADRTRELYRFVLDRHVLPSLGDVALALHPRFADGTRELQNFIRPRLRSRIDFSRPSCVPRSMTVSYFRRWAKLSV